MMRTLSKGTRLPQTANCFQRYCGQRPVPWKTSLSSEYISLPPNDVLEDMLQFLRVLFILGHERLIQVKVVVAVIENLEQIFLELIRTHSFEQSSEFKEIAAFRRQKFSIFPAEVLIHPVFDQDFSIREMSGVVVHTPEKIECFSALSREGRKRIQPANPGRAS